MEANPATLDRARLEAWSAVGLTRVSLGAQSTTAAGLRALGRTHRPEDVAAAVDAARSVGADVAIDLIFGWPGQTAGEWRADLARAIALGPDHVSCYPLELHLAPEEGAVNWPGGWAGVGRWRRDAAARQDEDVVAALYEEADAALGAAGFRHYEIANWARPGKRSLHNLTYWRNGEWLGVGAGAHSHLRRGRSHRPAGLAAYVAAIRSGAPRLADGDADPPVDTALLALRLDDGLDLARFASRFGEDAGARMRNALAAADPSLVEWRGPRVALTPRGRLLANEVLVALLPG